MDDEEIARALASCKGADPRLYHGDDLSEGQFEIEDGIIRLGDGDSFYSYPVDIAKFRAAFEVWNWQPIETAPKDGTVVDLWNGERVTDCFWTGAYWFGPKWKYDCGCEIRDDDPQPTHWMPLPDSPTERT